MTEGPGATRLQLLGGFELHGHDRIAISSQRLVSYLGLEGPARRTLPRRAVADVLWPDLYGETGLSRLRMAIWSLHDAVVELVTSTRTTVGLAPEVDVDVVRLQSWASCLLGGRPGDGRVPDPDDPCLHGVLLPEWDEPWLQFHRQRLDQLQLHVLDELRERSRRLGNLALAIDYALRVIERDPFRESAHAALIDLYYRDGNAHAARRHFARFSALMATEMRGRPHRAVDGGRTLP